MGADAAVPVKPKPHAGYRSDIALALTGIRRAKLDAGS